MQLSKPLQICFGIKLYTFLFSNPLILFCGKRFGSTCRPSSYSVQTHKKRQDLTISTLVLSKGFHNKVRILDHNKFYLKRLLTDDHDQVVGLTLRNSVTNEPSLTSLGMTKKEKGNFLLRGIRRLLKQNTCIGIVNKSTETLIGVVMLEIADSFSGFELSSHLPRLTLTLVEFDKFLETNLEKYIKGSRFCCLSGLVIDQTYCRQGLASILLRKSDEIATEFNCQYMVVVVATSVYSQKILENQGYSVCYETKYSDYVHPQTGEKPFVYGVHPHTHIKSYYKVL